jgi:uncharacterized protein YukE
MPGQINVPQSMAQTGPALLQTAQNITDELDSLKAIVAPYVGAVDWQGAANTNYGLLQIQWDLAAADLMSSEGTLAAIGNAVNTSWNNNVDTESTNTKMWAQ